MNNVKNAFDMVLGKDFVNEMVTRLIIIFACLAAVLAIILFILIWKRIACNKIKKAVLSLSEQPDDNQAEAFIESIGAISAFGRFMAKHSNGFAGLKKSDCRIIYNSTILPSSKMGEENKVSVRNCLISMGCAGLTDVNLV